MRAEDIFRMLRPACIGSLRFLALSRISDAHEWALWCDCHAHWSATVRISALDVETGSEKRGPPFTAIQKEQIAWELALAEGKRMHEAMVEFART